MMGSNIRYRLYLDSHGDYENNYWIYLMYVASI